MVRHRANITIVIIQEVWYLPSYGANANVVRRDSDLYFQGNTNFGNHILNIWKTVRASEKYSSMTCTEVDIGHRMAPLRMMSSVILTYVFKVANGESCEICSS